MNDAEHRQLRELLGAFAFGHLDPDTAAAVQAHLDGCDDCRVELEEIAPLAAALRRVDPAHLDDVQLPPPGLGQRIMAEVDAQRSRRGRSLLVARSAAGLVAAAALVAAFFLGAQVDPANDVADPPVGAPPVEAITVQAARPDVEATAGLVAHTWGTEIKLAASGLRDGSAYRVAFTDTDGRQTPAGTFLGTGNNTVTCSLNAALLRPEAVGVTVTDRRGTVVLSANLA